MPYRDQTTTTKTPTVRLQKRTKKMIKDSSVRFCGDTSREKAYHIMRRKSFIGLANKQQLRIIDNKRILQTMRANRRSTFFKRTRQGVKNVSTKIQAKIVSTTNNTSLLTYSDLTRSSFGTVKRICK